MAKVLLNGEQVNFEGQPPSSIGEVWTLLEGFLSQSGLEIDQFQVDGEAWAPNANAEPESYQTIEARSLSPAQSVERIVEALLSERQSLIGRWKAGSSHSLTRPWSQFQSEGLEILSATEPLAQSVGLLVEYAKQNQLPWSTAIAEVGERFNAALSSVMDAFESGDCIAYSDTVATAIQSGMSDLYDVLARQVLISSEKGGGV